MASVMEQQPEVEAGDDSSSLPIDVETIRQTVRASLSLQLSTSTRRQIFGQIDVLVGHLNLFLMEDFGEGERAEVLKVLRHAAMHVSPLRRPASGAHAHEALGYLRDAAVFALALTNAYSEKHKDQK